MLKGIHPAISPELLAVLCEMGHGDELLVADAHFPAYTCCRQVIRADGVPAPVLLEGISRLFPLDTYDEPLFMMQPVPGDEPDPSVEADYLAALRKGEPEAPEPILIERFAFYERAEAAFACVQSGETRIYGNIILKKGVVG